MKNFWVLLVGMAVLAVVLSVKAARTSEVPLIACLELAHREGIVVENEQQALRAKRKLMRMSSRDPLVRRCKAEVRKYSGAHR